MYLMNALRNASGLFITFILLVIFLGAEQSVSAANPPAVQEYYAPIKEADLLANMQSLFPSPVACGNDDAPAVIDPVVTVLFIAATAEDTLIYYDHWEDGFEVDLANPTQASTLVWGDDNPENGSVPGQILDVITAGTAIELQQEISTISPEGTDFDGGDRFGSTRAIAVSRAGWSVGPGTSLAGATELLNVGNWGQSYEIPVGPDSDGEQTFEHISLHIMAAENNTSVTLDRNGDGIVDFTTILNQGESHHENGGVVRGATLEASNPVQVQMVTGDVCTAYESRWYTLLPITQLGSSYYSPVSTDITKPTSIFLYNPNETTIVIDWEVLVDNVPTLKDPIILNSSASRMVNLPDESAAHFYTTSEAPFYALAAIDTTAVYDWGYTLWPESSLSQKAVVAWGPGISPNVVSNENGNPVWATVIMPDPTAGDVKLCVDYEGDNKVDTFYMLGHLERQPIFDQNPNDNDQSGMLLTVCDDSGAKVSAAWGPKPLTASPSLPGIDVGTAALPLPMVEAGAMANLSIDADLDGAVSAGDTIKYRVLVRNGGAIGLQGITLMGDVPSSTNYVADSTTIDMGSGVKPISDSGITPFPFDETTIPLGDLPVNGTLELSFDVEVEALVPAAVEQVTADFVLQAGAEQISLEVETPLNFEPDVALQKTVYIGHDSGGSCAGSENLSIVGSQPLTYCFTITNVGDTHLVDLRLDDVTLGVDMADMQLLSGEVTAPLAPNDSLVFYYETTVDVDTTNEATVSMTPADDTGAIREQLPTVTAVDTAIVQVQEPPTFTPTPTTSPTMTPTATGTATASPSPTMTATASPSPTMTATASPTPTASPTMTPTATGTATASPSPTMTATATVSPSPTITATASPSPTMTNTPTISPTLTVTPTITATITSTITPTLTITPTDPLYLGDVVWVDVNNDGVQNDAKDGFSGITVNLYDDADQLVATTVTDLSGRYHFDMLMLPDSSSYQLKLDNPIDYRSDGSLGDFYLTTADVGADDMDSDAFYDSAGYPTIVIDNLDTTNDIGFVAGSCRQDTIGQFNPNNPSSATVTNQSDNRSYLVGLAVYQKVDEVIDHQILFDFQTTTVLPNQTVDLAVDMPNTALQIDLFCGPVLYSLDGQRYENRLIDAMHIGGTYASDGMCPADYATHGVYQDQIISGEVIIELQTDQPIDNWFTFRLTGPDSIAEHWRERFYPYYFKGDQTIDGQVIPNGWNTEDYPDGAYSLWVAPNDADCQPLEIDFAVQNTLTTVGGVKGKVLFDGLPKDQVDVVMEPVNTQVESGRNVSVSARDNAPATYVTQTNLNGDYQFDNIPFGLYEITLGEEGTSRYVHLQANAAGYMDVSFIEGTVNPTAVLIKQVGAQPVSGEAWTIIATFVLLIMTVLYLDHHFVLRRQ